MGEQVLTLLQLFITAVYEGPYSLKNMFTRMYRKLGISNDEDLLFFVDCLAKFSKQAASNPFVHFNIIQEEMMAVHLKLLPKDISCS